MRRKFFSLLLSAVLIFTAQKVPVLADGMPPVKDTPKLQIPVMSDIHINGEVQKNNFIRALKDYNKIAPGYKAIALIGDITDHGAPKEYDDFMDMLKTNANPGAEKIITLGNHELFERNSKSNNSITDRLLLDRFKQKTGMPGVYYDKWVSDYHFITLGSEGPGKNPNPSLDFAYFSEEQYKWLEKTLPLKAEPTKPIFVFLHQPIDNTVYGSEYWGGNLKDGRLLNILKKYPQVILFTGHSHCVLNHPRTVYQDGFTMVNTSSVYYTWYENGAAPEKYSQGLLVDVYGDRVEIKAREFSTGTWINTYTVRLPFRNTTNDTVKPLFKPDAKGIVEKVDAVSAALTWDAASDNTLVDRYVVKHEGKVIHTEYIKFWESNKSNNIKAVISDLKPLTKYKLDIYAVDAWNNESAAPIKVEVTTEKPKEWVKMGNNQYYFDPDTGFMKRGWLFYDHRWYYLGKFGEMKTGWVTDGGNRYYMSQSGVMKTGWLFLGDDRYYLDDSGVMKTGWIFEGDRWYYFEKNGMMKTGWLTENGNKYYLAPNGTMKTGEVTIDGKKYNFSESGILIE